MRSVEPCRQLRRAREAIPEDTSANKGLDLPPMGRSSIKVMSSLSARAVDDLIGSKAANQIEMATLYLLR
jgi:hypothetical protein